MRSAWTFPAIAAAGSLLVPNSLTGSPQSACHTHRGTGDAQSALVVTMKSLEADVYRMRQKTLDDAGFKRLIGEIEDRRRTGIDARQEEFFSEWWDDIDFDSWKVRIEAAHAADHEYVFKTWLERFPNSEDAWYEFERQHSGAGSNSYEEILPSHRDSWALWLRYSEVLRSDGHSAESDRALLQAIEKVGDDLSGLIAVAREKYFNHQRNEAIEFLSRAASHGNLDSKQTEAWFTLARYLELDESEIRAAIGEQELTPFQRRLVCETPANQAQEGPCYLSLWRELQRSDESPDVEYHSIAGLLWVLGGASESADRLREVVKEVERPRASDSARFAAAMWEKDRNHCQVALQVAPPLRQLLETERKWEAVTFYKECGQQEEVDRAVFDALARGEVGDARFEEFLMRSASEPARIRLLDARLDDNPNDEDLYRSNCADKYRSESSRASCYSLWADRFPRSAEPWQRRAEDLDHAKRWADAAPMWAKALRRASRDIGILRGSIENAWQRRDLVLVAALDRDLDRIASTPRQRAETHLYAGRLLLAAAKREQAFRELAKYEEVRARFEFEMDEDFVELGAELNQRARLTSILGDAVFQWECFRTRGRPATRTMIERDLAFAFENAHRPDWAIDFRRTVLKSDPTDSWSWNGLAEDEEALAMVTQAGAHFRRAATRNPTYFEPTLLAFLERHPDLAATGEADHLRQSIEKTRREDDEPPPASPPPPPPP